MVRKFTSAEVLETFSGEHKSVLSRINQFCIKLSESSLEQEIIFLISEIHAVIAIHFKQEEAIMKQQHDVKFTKHKVDHESFLAELKYLMENAEIATKDNLGESLLQRCTTWFTAHYEIHDNQNLAGTNKAPDRLSV